MCNRKTLLIKWLSALGYQDYDLQVASTDASFRNYYRLQKDGETWIVMDAPPQQESCLQFIKIAHKLRLAGLSAPVIMHENIEQGFLILTDFGSQDYLSILNDQTATPLYADAIAVILQMQNTIDTEGLVVFDGAFLNREMDIFHDWFLTELLKIKLTDKQQQAWLSVKKTLTTSALEQPQLFMHRDFHSRNLMKLDQGNPGILDFQDAVKGPISYDLVSLLRDCYIQWPAQRIEQLMLEYYRLAFSLKLTHGDEKQFKFWFNLMGVQRHLKVLGLFSRLKMRDDKPGYLKDLPRVLQYIIKVCDEEISLAGLSSLIQQLDLQTRVKALCETDSK